MSERKNEIDLKCGCGRDARYYSLAGDNPFGEPSCNKYMRCPTYEELSAAMGRANSLLNAYRMKRAVDGLNGRTWHASKHFEAEALIEELEKPFSEILDRMKRHLEQQFPNAKSPDIFSPEKEDVLTKGL